MADSIRCVDCNLLLPLEILQSATGYYVGRLPCPNCGPYGFVSYGYYASHEAAQVALDSWNALGVADPETTHDTDFHGEDNE